jgi:predicted RNA-binding Zn-ribbon protein involved in translation (DUF1610 family)
MVDTAVWVVLGVAVGCVVVAVVLYALIFRRGRKLGTKGVVQRSHLLCPKCGREFDYDWIPGASFTAVRLGTGRYMSCPLCGKWSVFDVYGTMTKRIPPPESDSGASSEH